MQPQISVVIVTRNRPGKLFQVLSELAKSSFTHFEVIVIDQSDQASVSSKFLRFKREFQRFRYVHSFLRGKSHGLNEAIFLCRSQIIAFTDDDCIPDKNWLQILHSRFNTTKDICGVFGETKPYQPQKHSHLFCPSTFVNIDPLPHKIMAPVLPSKEVGVGNNMAFRKSFFEEMGPFKSWLGPGSFGSNGEDSEIALRALFAGKVLFYEPKAIVFHDRWLNLKELFIQDLSYLCGEFACYQYYALTGNSFAKEFLNLELRQEILKEVRELITQITQFKKFAFTLLFWFILRITARARGVAVGTVVYIAKQVRFFVNFLKKSVNQTFIFNSIFFPIYREYYYFKKAVISKINAVQKYKNVNYEKYFSEGKHSNYDYFWVKGGIPENFINRYFLSSRLEELKKITKSDLKKKKILDLGCAGGMFLALAERSRMETYGVDISRSAVEDVNNTTSSLAKVCDLTSQKIPFESSSFDFVTAFDLVEHVKDTKHLFSEVKRVLKPNGVFYFITPNEKQPADHDETHYSLKNKKAWEEISSHYFKILTSYTYDYFPPPPYLLIQKILSFYHQLTGYKIQQVVVIAQKKH